MDPRIYIGWRDRGGCRVYRVIQGRFSKLPPKNHLRNHSPAGFEWGYGGSGPSQLALALAADLLEDEDALVVYQELKTCTVARLEMSAWILREEYLRSVLLMLWQDDPATEPGPRFRAVMTPLSGDSYTAPRTGYPI